jgi:hypothetical protein
MKTMLGVIFGVLQNIFKFSVTILLKHFAKVGMKGFDAGNRVFDLEEGFLELCWVEASCAKSDGMWSGRLPAVIKKVSYCLM